jgi:hypothetical protein
MVQGALCPTGEGSQHELQIVPEPEAASLFCLQSLRQQEPTFDTYVRISSHINLLCMQF